MNIRNAVERLKRQAEAECPGCQWVTLRTAEAMRGADPVFPTQPTCPSCGRAQRTVDIIEVVVAARKQFSEEPSRPTLHQSPGEAA
jgi:hypothetical protein